MSDRSEIPDGEASSEPPRRFQFSLKTLLMLAQGVNLVYAVPGMLGLILLLLFWTVPAAVIVGALMLVQLPVWWIIRSLAVPDEERE